MEHEPGLREDAKNLSVVTGSAIVAALITMGLFVNQMTAAPERIVVRELAPIVEVVVPEAPEAPPLAPLSGTNRLYGTVTTVYGSDFTGYIRWDRNEGSWTDLLDATKPRENGGSSLSGIRFGHVQRIDVVDRNSALFTLRSGEQVRLTGNASDLGSGLRALIVDDGAGTLAEFEWRDLERVAFTPPGATPPSESRLFGTLTTRSGLEFTGFVTWDIDEIYSTDVLDGDLDGRRVGVAFGDIASIERNNSWGSRVTLRSGEVMILEGTNDVDASISGISVSDAGLGQVKLSWEEFANVRFHGTESESALADFDGGSRLFGTVRTEDGGSYTGDITWDADEAFTWEMLNGEMRGVNFQVEFGTIARIAKAGRGAAVTLKDGRTFELSNSNDVDRGNRGILIHTDGRDFEIAWDNFAELTLGR
ncbi:MAG: hypothetical protein O2958_03250 [Gemmatimonadetes bacterium]|nr:hypothetical protein [Gemmatimonadota bacterium]MDA1102336.1 hypothetical protein [Gemmatimonadota bacterium]